MNKIQFLIFALVFALALGCNQQSTGPESANRATEPGELPVEVQDVYQQYSVGDDELLTSLDLATNGDWPDPADTSYDLYAVTFLWGPFLPDTDGTEIDWSGGVQINAEAYLRPVHVIDFETGQDSLVPEDLPAAVQWHSTTQMNPDGIRMLLFYKRGIVYIAAPMLTFDTPPLKLEFTMDRLERLAAFFRVDDRNGVAVFAHKLKRRPCPHGVLHGTWTKDDGSETSGHFEALWVNYMRDSVGLMSGRFWVDSTGRGRLAGSLSGVYTDEVKAELEGTWRYDDPRMCALCGTAHGWFHGRFKFTSGEGGGYFAGEFGDFTYLLERELPMRGRWRAHCDHLASDVVVTAPE